MSLQVDGNADYVANINLQLGVVRSKGTGGAVLAYIERSGRHVRIRPMLRTTAVGTAGHTGAGWNNAVTTPASWSASGTFSSQRHGAGSDATIEYSPENLSGHSPGQLHDEILCHELCHALREIYGVELLARNHGWRPIGGGFEDVEEFFACSVTSIYSSQWLRPLRGNHDRAGMRDPGQMERPPFSTYIRMFRRQMPQFTNELAQIPAAFNPFRDLPL
ncbi:MAG: M91 family zinc metallopeptidase [Acidobacteriota bacterium]